MSMTPIPTRGFDSRPISENLGTGAAAGKPDDYSGRVWRELRESLSYTTWIAGEERCIAIPKGFRSDLASIPRRIRLTWLPQSILKRIPWWLVWLGSWGIPLWGIFPPVGAYDPAAWLHDYCYSVEGETSKELADALFDEAMKDLGVRWRRPLMVLAVRWFAGWAYHSR